MNDKTESYVVGVDGGGSKTVAIVLDEQGQAAGRGQGGSANYHHVGLAGMRAALTQAIQAALQDAGISLDWVRAMTWALAGVDRPDERRFLLDLAAELAPGIAVQIENDALAALVGGVGTRRGVVLIAGTGMIVYGEDGQGGKARAGGWGYLLEHGGGYGLGRAALRAITLAHDGCRLPTRLAERVLVTLNLAQPADIVTWLYAPDRQVADIAALAPLVLAEAEAGDVAALDITAQAADALAEAVGAVARRLGLDINQFPLVLAGGLLTGNLLYRELVTQAVRSRVPFAQPMLPYAEAAVGAAWLALATLGHPLESRQAPPAAGADRRTWTSEQANRLSRDLDLRPTLEMVALMHAEDRRMLAAVRSTLPVIAQVVDAVAERMRRGGRLIYLGAGTSGRLGVLDAAECPPTFNAPPGQVIGVIAGGNDALTSSAEGAEDDAGAGRQAVAGLDVKERDSVVGIAASGRTPYVVAGLEEARRRGALTVALTCNLPAPLAEPADYVLAPLVGPEVITGSTRLKAGTAQKLTLNMLSTAVMVRLGKTYGNLMVDVRALNAKLRARARRIVAQACRIDDQAAEAALARSDGEVKVAIVGYLAGCSPQAARDRLARAGGMVRAASEISLKNP
jgi:N-acetylmuramic acid 6-phosphate etherase